MVKRQITLEKEVSSPRLQDVIVLTQGSIPVTLDFANILGLNILLLPVGRGNDGKPRSLLQFAVVDIHRCPLH
jgi:hypothetical protein